MTRIKSIIVIHLILAGMFLSSCAYFNTFYNAKTAFDTAEKLRNEKSAELLPRDAKTNYLKVIKKSEIVLDKYAGSKYEEEAYFLMGKSRYHLGEVLTAEKSFLELLEKFPDSKNKNELELWLHLCKWKQGKVQTAIYKLNELLERDMPDALATEIYLALAEINLELEKNTEALDLFGKAAGLARESHDKDQINNRISELAFGFKDYVRAEKAYRQVIKYSFIKSRKETAQLQILKILRLTNELDKAMADIKDLLQDENFTRLYSDFEMELAKIYFEKNEDDKAISRLKKITLDYPQTSSSAEAYYLLGEDAILRLWDIEQANEYFGKIAKEYSQSIFRLSGGTRVREINTYKNDLAQYDEMVAELTESDSLSGSEIDTLAPVINEEEYREKIIEQEKTLFSIAEMEYFQFKKYELSKTNFEKVLSLNTDSELMIKSIYILVSLHEITGNSVERDKYRERLLSDYPFTDYAADLRKKMGMELDIKSPGKLLSEAEKKWKTGDKTALDIYREIIDLDSLGMSAQVSSLFLAHYYENTDPDLDSALHYYKWIENAQYSEEYTKVAVTSRKRIEAYLNPKLEPAEIPDIGPVSGAMNDSSNVPPEVPMNPGMGVPVMPQELEPAVGRDLVVPPDSGRARAKEVPFD